MNNPILPLPEFWDALKHFDWNYEYSDDMSIFRAAAKRMEELRAMTFNSEPHKALLEQASLFCRHGKGSMPARPQ